MDALNRSDITAERIIMPGIMYKYPSDRGKLNILNTGVDDIISAVERRGGEVSKALIDVLEGFSPLVCREIAFSAFGQLDVDVKEVDLSRLSSPLEACLNAIKISPVYTALYENGVPKEYSFIDINEYGNTYEKRRFSFSGELLDAFYSERDKAGRLKKQSGDIQKTVSNMLSRAKRRMGLREKDLKATEDRETLRIYGELIKANIHAVKTGDSFCSVQNFYDENLSEVKIKLDPALSPAANAAKYFKEYKKSCAASVNLKKLIEGDKKEIDYLDSVLESIERAGSTADIAEIKQELVSTGYIKEKRSARKPAAGLKIEEHVSEEGYRILVGHNNVQNDFITGHLADKSDTWFHTKSIHGSHVVVKNGGGDVSEQTVLFAAKLAAKNSRAGKSANVPVDYTPVKYVKKPAGAKPGMVIYTTNKTVFVTPLEDLLESRNFNVLPLSA